MFFDGELEGRRSLPGGMLWVFFGLLAFVFAGLSGYAAWLASETDKLTEAERSATVLKYAGMSAAGLLVSLGLNYAGFRQIMNLGSYDQNDPKEPLLKF